jgi:glycosyltransferase involved in cell wall biosynthesis
MSSTVRGLREIGVDARGIALFGAKAVVADDGIAVLSAASSRRSARWAADILRAFPRLLSEIRGADILHWYMTPGLPFGADLSLARFLGKPAIVEFVGGDIRRPSVEAVDNPYYVQALPQYEYRAWETDANSVRTQQRFAGAGAEVLVSCPSLLPYLDETVFAQPHVVRQRIVTSDFRPVFPDPDKRRPLIVHATTAPVAKGTGAVLAAIESLKGRHDFEFVLLRGVPHADALRTIQAADIYLDQFVLGAHGAAALEAMALGTPVVGWIKPAVAREYPVDLPLVNATKENLTSAVADLLTDGERRARLGRDSRAYVEAHHDAARLGRRLVSVYDGVIRRRKG